MPASTLIIDWLGEGTHAARPAAPAIPVGGIAIYYETDTGSTFVWDTNGAAWVQIAGTGFGGFTSRGMTVTGNTTGATSSTTAVVSAVSFSGAGAASVGFQGGTIVVSVPAVVASGTANSEYALGNTTAATSSTVQTLQSLSVSGAGGVSVGFSTTAANQGVLIVSGATTAASGTVQNLTVLGNTNQATSSFADTLSARSISATGGLSAGFDTNGVLILSGGAGGGGATSQDYFALGNTTAATSSGTASNSALSISGAGAVSVGLSTTAAGANVWVVSSPATVASGTAENMVALGNTFGATSSSVLTLTAMSVSATGGISAGFSTTGAGAGVLELSVAPPIASATAQNITVLGNTNQATSSFADTLTGRSVSATGGLSAGFDTNGVLILSGAAGGAGATSDAVLVLGHTTGSTSSGSNAFSGVSFSAAGGMSIGYTTTGAGANVLIFSGAAAGGGSISFTSTPASPPDFLTTRPFTAASITLQPFNLWSSLVINQIRLPLMINATGNLRVISDSTSSAASRSVSQTYNQSLSVFIYSTTAFEQWTSIASAQNVISATITISESGSSWSQGCTWNIAQGTTTTSFSVSVTTATAVPDWPTILTISSMFASNSTRPMRWDFPLAATIPPGINHMIGVMQPSITNSGATGAGAGTTRFQLAAPAAGDLIGGNTAIYPRMQLPGGASTSSNYYGNITSTLSNSFNASDLLQSGVINWPYGFVCFMGTFA